MKHDTYLIVDNIRSTHNVGSLLRTAEGLGVKEVFLCGITPYPTTDNDSRLPHLSHKLTSKISKTALGAEKYQTWRHCDKTSDAIDLLRKQAVEIIALEQTEHSRPLLAVASQKDIALVVGNEVTGISEIVLGLCDQITDIEMQGKKESLNVSVAAAIALFYLTNML